MKLFKRKEKFYPEPPPAPYPYEELKEKCPVCNIRLKGNEKIRGSAFLGLHNSVATYSCANCLTWEGRQVAREGYVSEPSGFLGFPSNIPPVYSGQYVTFRKTS